MCLKIDYLPGPDGSDGWSIIIQQPKKLQVLSPVGARPGDN